MSLIKKYVWLFLVALLFACNKHKTYNIGVSQCSSGAWRDKMNMELLAAHRLYDSEADISIANCHEDPSLQVKQIDSLIDANVDLKHSLTTIQPLSVVTTKMQETNLQVMLCT